MSVNMNKPKSCAGKDNFERMNYLYQLSNITFLNQNTASALYSNLLLNVAKKSVQRVEPDIKRTVCKKCHTLLAADMSAKVRIRKKRVRWTCKQCCTSKVFKAVPNYFSWLQDPHSLIDVFKY